MQNDTTVNVKNDGKNNDHVVFSAVRVCHISLE